MRLIGIVGATGAVGRAVVQNLSSGPWHLRLGARRLQKLPSELVVRHETVSVDVQSPSSLERFCKGCALVVNAAGPTELVMDRVLRAAVMQGASYVDVAGDETVFDLVLKGSPLPNVPILLSAGIMPGLSALLPRYLIEHVGADGHLQCWLGGLDRFTKTAAKEYVASLQNGYGTPSAAWRSTIVPQALTRQENISVAAFPRPVTAYPYLSQENVRVATSLKLHAGDWYNAFEGRQICVAFSQVQALLSSGDPAAAVKVLCHAADMDLAGRRAYQTISLRYQTKAGDITTLALQTNDGYALSGAFAACVVKLVMSGDGPLGVHFAGEVMPAERLLRDLRRSSAITSLVETTVSQSDAVENVYESGIL